MRVQLAAVLGRIGPMTIPDLAAEAGVAPVDVGQALERCEWFKHLRDGRFNLTSIGRREAELD